MCTCIVEYFISIKRPSNRCKLLLYLDTLYNSCKLLLYLDNEQLARTSKQDKDFFGFKKFITYGGKHTVILCVYKK